MIGFCSSPRFVEHATGPHHPERPDRIRAIYRALHTAGLIDSEDPFPDFALELGAMPPVRGKLVELQPAAAEERWLELVHPQSHIEHVKQACEAGGMLDHQGDTPVGPGSYEIALLALGAVLRSCDAVMKGEVRRAFAAVRPPGHHAEPGQSMGFCLFSNVAIAARYLQQAHGVGKVAIVDFDVHHGNGTQAIFDTDRSVYFVSLHEDPHVCYPGSGYSWEIGTGAGRGSTMNVPLPPGSTDRDYLRVIDLKVVPALDKFRPEVLLISAGFDAHVDDPLAQIELSDEAFELMTCSLVRMAERHCGGRVISVLEGGYNLPALGRSVIRHLVGLGAC